LQKVGAKNGGLMRTRAVAFVVVFTALVAAKALAQGATPEATFAELNRAMVGAGYEPQRTPMMIVTEAPPSTGSAARQSKLAKPPSPIVIPSASTILYSAGDVTTGNPDYDRMVMESAARNGVDPRLIISVMRQESGFNPRARSYKGACGLMQLMPATARRFGVTKIFDPAENIEGGARYLRFLLDMFAGDVELALAGYNAGEGAVVGAGYRVPRYRETQTYVRSISARYNSIKHARSKIGGATASCAPAAIVLSGGTSNRLSNNY
jgi:soluble lytic murein transglycosylase-like protein